MRQAARIGVWCAAGILCCACGGGDETDRTALVCHRPDADAQVIEVAAAELPEHTAHGDYIARFVVDPRDRSIGDGIHFARIGDALATARAGRIARGELRAAACGIAIDVSSGVFRGSFEPSAAPTLEQFPLVVDVPGLTLRGGLRMIVDAHNRATGASEDEAAVTTLAPDRPLVDAPLAEGIIVVAGHPDGPRGDGAVIEGFAFQSAEGGADKLTGGTGVFSLRVDDLVVRGNRFGAKLTTALALQATTARIERNHALRLGFNCSFCLVGPGNYAVEGNRLVEGDLGGIYLAAIGGAPFSLGANPVAPVEPYVVPESAAMSATVANNDIRGHVRQPIGFAVRMIARGSGPASVPQALHVALRDNDFAHNTFSLIVDAGFPAADSLVGADVDVSLDGNRFGGSCQDDLLVAFMRHQGALGVTTNPPVHNAAYRLALHGDLAWNDAWYAHPPGLGNTLVVDGNLVPPASKVPYDPARPCSL